MGLSPDMEIEPRQDCACPFDAPGSAHPVLGDTCFADCLAAFLSSKFNQAQVNDVVCRSLQESGGGGDAFYPLYYLDQKWCGLVPRSLFGQDPNVDVIINTCNGINFPNLTDPGVPPQSYRCNLCTQSTSNEANRPTEGPAMHLSTTSTSFTTTEPTTTISLEPSTSSASSSITSTNSVAATATTDPTSVTPEYSLPTTASASTVTQSRDQLPTEAIVAIAVCTALAVIGAVLLLLCVLRRRQKQQNDYSSDMRNRISRVVQDFTIPPASSPQPLISPTQSYTADQPPLTPPLRLRDRKLLPSLLRPLSRPESIVFGPPFDTHHSNHSSSSHYSGYSQKRERRGGGESFPTSPICSPTHDKLEPRQEKKAHHKVASSFMNPVAPLPSEPSSPPYTRLKSPPPVAFTFPPRSTPDNLHHQYAGAGSPPPRGTPSLRREIMSTSTTSSDYNQDHHANAKTSSASTATTTAVAQQEQHSTAVSMNPFAPTPPSSPIRPRRPHNEPLEIPDLVSPLTATTSPTSPSPGPPPSRALPPPPPPPPGSGRTSSAASEIGIATTTTASVGAGAGTRRSPGSISLRSLQEQRQGGAGEGRPGTAGSGSWGSWEDRSIVGVAMSPPGRGAGTVYPYPDR